LRVLLTNDDGVHAEGLAAIRERLIELCESVIVVAPEADSSGFARKCTFSRPVNVRRIGAGRHPVYSCDGTPTDCVRVGLLGGLAADADLVVSGINHGSNLADDVTYSGTVGAGLEAAVLGTSALCLSQQTPTGSFSVNYNENLAELGLAYDFGIAAGHGGALAASIVDARPDEPIVLSVNYPTTLSDRSAILTRAGRRKYPRAAKPAPGNPSDVQSVWVFGEPDEVIPDDGDSQGTDISALRAGRISVTPLSAAVSLGDLSPATQAFFGRLERGLNTVHGLPASFASSAIERS